MILAAFLGGAVAIFSKKALKQIPPIPFVFLRFAAASLVILPLLFTNKIQLRKFVKAIPVSLLLTANVTLFTFGVQRTTASITQILYTGTTLVAAILSYFLLKERINRRKVAGILLGFGGTLVIILLPALEKGASFHGSISGNLMIMAAMFFTAAYSVMSKRLHKEYTPLELTIYFILTTLILLTLLLPFDTHNHPSWWLNLDIKIVLDVLYVGVICTVVYYLIYQQVIKLASPTIASMILYLQPVFAVIWAGALLGERVTTGFVAGSILVFMGVALTNSKKRKILKKTRSLKSSAL